MKLSRFEHSVMMAIVRTRNDNPRDITHAVGLNPDSAEDLGRVLKTIADLCKMGQLVIKKRGAK